MTPLEPWRQALRSLIPRGFLQRDRAADGLFISDYPCHCADAAAVDAALQAAGFQVTAAGRLRRIVPGVDRGSCPSGGGSALL